MLREQFRRITEQDIFNHFVIFLILLNTVILGLLTFDFSSSFITVLDSLDNVILILFIIELGIKMYAFGPPFLRINGMFSIWLSSVFPLSLCFPHSASFEPLGCSRFYDFFAFS